MKLEWPLALVGLAVVPAAAFAYLQLERRRARFALRFTNVDVLASIEPAEAPLRRFAPPGMLLAALALALFALARPQFAHSIQREEATIVLVVDTSGSMIANDVQPTRLAAAQEAVRRFVDKLPARYRVGIVSFATQPRVTIPVTEDHEVAVQGLQHMTAFGGTAIGDAIDRAVQLIKKGPAAPTAPSAVIRGPDDLPPSAIVLLSDGAQNRGQLLPRQGAAAAKKLSIPVYTVALGTQAGTIHIGDGAFSETISVPPDPRTLKQIALETGGRFYSAASSARLNAVYEGLASRLSVRREYRETTFVFLGASAVLLLAAGVLSAFWLPRLP